MSINITGYRFGDFVDEDTKNNEDMNELEHKNKYTPIVLELKSQIEKLRTQRQYLRTNLEKMQQRYDEHAKICIDLFPKIEIPIRNKEELDKTAELSPLSRILQTKCEDLIKKYKENNYGGRLVTAMEGVVWKWVSDNDKRIISLMEETMNLAERNILFQNAKLEVKLIRRFNVFMHHSELCRVEHYSKLQKRYSVIDSNVENLRKKVNAALKTDYTFLVDQVNLKLDESGAILANEMDMRCSFSPH